MSDMLLANIALPGLVIESDIAPVGVRAETTKTLSGRLVIWESAEHGGRNIDLVGGSDYGWLMRTDLVALQALAAIPRATYTLVLADGAGDLSVRFRNEDAPAIEATPIIPRPNPADTDWYNNIRIKLMEV